MASPIFSICLSLFLGLSSSAYVVRLRLVYKFGTYWFTMFLGHLLCRRFKYNYSYLSSGINPTKYVRTFPKSPRLLQVPFVRGNISEISGNSHEMGLFQELELPSHQPLRCLNLYFPFPYPDTGAMTFCSTIPFRSSDALDGLISIASITSERPKIVCPGNASRSFSI